MAGGYGRRYRKARAMVLASGDPCAHCGRPATEADHQPPLSRHDHRDGSGCCVLVPSCWWCARQQAVDLALGVDLPDVPARETPPEPAGFGPEDRVWRVPWLDGLLDVPANATWARVMTVPPPAAAGSLGGEVCGWAEGRTGPGVRWWQQLGAAGVLEDERGRLRGWGGAG